MSELKHPSEKEEKISNEAYENLLDQYQFATTELTPGKQVTGKIIKITPTHVLLDIGFKSEGMIPLEEFGTADDLKHFKPGDNVEAVLDRTDAKEGYLILSKRQADVARAIDHLEKAYTTQSFITGKVVERNKNGYLVDFGIKAFMPESHADTRPVKDPDKLVGQSLKFKVIKFDRKNENAVVSHKLFLQDEREKKRRRVFGKLVKGEKIKGQIKSLTSFGAFVDLGGIEGLLHISDMSWGKIGHPSELFKNGQEIEVVVLDFNEKDEKISLGYKHLTKDPWQTVKEKYAVGQRIKGKVVSLTDFGAFVELEKGVEGLVHISDLTWSRKLVHPKKVLTVGQEVEVSVLDVNPDTKRISLGLKQVQPHPLEILKQKYGPGSRIKGVVTSVTDFGAFLEIEKGIEGLIHISDISWEKIKHPSDKLKVGDEIEVVVLNIDVEKQKISLGIKQLEGDIWEDFFSRHRAGDLVKVKIVRLTDFGVFVEILPGIEGVVFLSELDEKKLEKPSEMFSVGDERQAKIIKLNPRDKKISLSFRQAQFDLQRQEYKKFVQSQDNKLTFGDIMKDQLKGIISSKKETPNKEG